MKISVIIPVYNQEKLVLRALDSVPIRNDIEIIVIDDGSTDNTFKNVSIYQKKHLRDKKITLLRNKENQGVATTLNVGYDRAKGEYIVLLGSDDYFYPSEFNKILPLLDGTDLIYFNLKINSGDIWELTSSSKNFWVGSVKFMRREFIGNTRCIDGMREEEDYYFYKELQAKNPTERFSNITLKHYNFPRKDSLCYLKERKNKNAV